MINSEIYVSQSSNNPENTDWGKRAFLAIASFAIAAAVVLGATNDKEHSYNDKTVVTTPDVHPSITD